MPAEESSVFERLQDRERRLGASDGCGDPHEFLPSGFRCRRSTVTGFSRFVARRFLGAGVFKYAFWEEAIDNLERAAELDPGRIYHHLDLAEVYLDRKRETEARAELEKVAGLPERDVLDPVYKARAAALLTRLEQAGDKS